MNPLEVELIDILPIVCGVCFVSTVNFVPDGEVGKNWRYGYPEGLEKVVGVAAFTFGAINFRFIIRLIYMCLRTKWTSLKFLLDDFAVRFVCESFAASLGTILAGHWWIRYNSLSRCVRNPEGKACEYEPQLIVEFQRILLNMVYSKPDEYPDFLDGCKPPPFHTFAYFVHALPALVYTVCLGMFTYFTIKYGNHKGGGGGGGKDSKCVETKSDATTQTTASDFSEEMAEEKVKNQTEISSDPEEEGIKEEVEGEDDH